MTRNLSPGSRLAVALVAFAGFTILAYREAVLGTLLGGLSERTAGATLAVLGWLGVDAVREATVLYQPGGFAFEIYYRCTGFLPAAFLATVILASPVGSRRKLIGLAVGVPLIGVLNLLRLVHLFVIGATRPEFFDFAHGVLWEGAMVLAAFGLWWVWKRWADGDGKENSMRRDPLRPQAPAVALLVMLAVTGGCAAAQSPAESGGGVESAAIESGGVEPADVEPAEGSLTCEVSCSETELRTAVARISWLGPRTPAGGGAAGPSLAEELQTTVYKGGFDRDLYASFALGGEATEPKTATDLPAYDLELVEVTRPAGRLEAAAGGGGAARTTVVVEGLEPGMVYTWRLVFETAEGRMISETVTCEAPMCTADYVPGGPAGGMPGGVR